MNPSPIRRRRLAPAALLALALAAPAQAAYVYSTDDGIADASVVVPEPGKWFTFTFAKRYSVAAGGETVESVASYFDGGPPGSFQAYGRLWADPDGDGLPTDAALLASSALVTRGGSGWEVFDIPDITLAPGINFFVGITVTFLGGTAPIGIDKDAPFGSSWFGTLAPMGASAWGDFMIRANAKGSGGETLPNPPGTLPAPAPLTLAAAGLVLLGLQRRVAGRR